MNRKMMRASGLAVCLALELCLMGGCQGGGEVSRPEAAVTEERAEETSTPSPPPAPLAEATEPPPAEQEEEIPEPEEQALLPEAFPMEMGFSSGAGAWGTYIILERDGSFTGHYHDSEMGDMGDGYPGGTVYVCQFRGQFTDIVQESDTSWRMTLENLTAQAAEGEEWIEDGIRYVTSVPYGLESGAEFLLYAPETPTEGLNGEFLSWWPGRYAEQPSQTLSYYGLYNVEMGYGFFSGEQIGSY